MEDRADEIFYREDAACIEQPLAKNPRAAEAALSGTEAGLEDVGMSKKHHQMPARKCSECGIVLGKDYPYDLCPKHFISNYGYAPAF